MISPKSPVCYNSPVSNSSWPLNKSAEGSFVSQIITNTGKKVSEFEFKTIDEVVHRSSSEWNL